MVRVVSVSGARVRISTDVSVVPHCTDRFPGDVVGESEICGTSTLQASSIRVGTPCALYSVCSVLNAGRRHDQFSSCGSDDNTAGG